MSLRSHLSNFGRALRGFIGLMGKPVEKDSGSGSFAIHPFRGYGSKTEVFLMGRLVRQRKISYTAPHGALSRDLLNLGRRILRRGLCGMNITARFGDAEESVLTDRNGYFRVLLHPVVFPDENRLWHQMELTLPGPDGTSARGNFFVPPPSARYVVISDIDDTVMFTGVAHKLKMLWRLFIQGAESRVAFPGVAAFYRALHRGRDGNDLNPILYVSRGPWSLYEVLDEFFSLHDIPVGPILFLRDWGVSVTSPLPSRKKEHKSALIRRMLNLYNDLPFILIGDSGQRDPEIYTRIIREYPGRVQAVYIRNISRDPARDKAVAALAEDVVAAGSTILLAADSFAMAEHAAERGLISEIDLDEVLGERITEKGAAELKPVARVVRLTDEKVEQDVEKALGKGTKTTEAPNVIVEQGGQEDEA